MCIRKVQTSDVGRLAEIIVFNNRVNFYPIFQDIQYSFGEYNVFSVADQFIKDEEFMNHCFVYEDEVIKGFVYVVGSEIKKLYVDVCLQGMNIGSKLLEFAINECGANTLWALEKNEKAIRFYTRHGFVVTNEKILEEGTSEYLVRLVKVGE